MPTSATPELDAPDLGERLLRLGSRLLVRRRQVRSRVAIAGGALRRRRLDATNPRVEPALEVAGDNERAGADVGPEQPEERILALAGKNRTRHPDAVRLGRVVPRVPVDAEPAVSAGDGQRVEDCVRGGVGGQAETAEDARDRGVQDPAGRLTPAHRLHDEEQAAQLRGELRLDDVRARVRGGGERGRVDATRPVHEHVDAAEALDCRVDHCRHLRRVVQIGSEDGDLVALVAHPSQPAQPFAQLDRRRRIFAPCLPLGGIGKRGAAEQDELCTGLVEHLLGEVEADVAHAAGDHHDRVFRQAGGRVSRVDRQRLVRLDEARTRPKRDRGLGRPGAQFGEDLVGDVGVRVDVEVREAESRVLLRQHLRRADPERPRRIDLVVGIDTRHSPARRAASAAAARSAGRSARARAASARVA